MLQTDLKYFIHFGAVYFLNEYVFYLPSLVGGSWLSQKFSSKK
jgi:hypothetical protein